MPTIEEDVLASVGDVTNTLPKNLRRIIPPNLPELSEVEVVRHFVRLSQLQRRLGFLSAWELYHEI